MAITEWYANSVNTSCLTDDARHHQTDVLAAVALSSKLGSLLYRIKFAGDQSSLVPLLEIWRVMVAKSAKRRGWVNVAEEVADISLWHWIEDVCRPCKGRGRTPVVGQDEHGRQVLSNEPCPVCHGSKKRPLTCDRPIRDHVRDCCQTLDRMAGYAERAARDKLG